MLLTQCQFSFFWEQKRPKTDISVRRLFAKFSLFLTPKNFVDAFLLIILENRDVYLVMHFSVSLVSTLGDFRIHALLKKNCNFNYLLAEMRGKPSGLKFVKKAEKKCVEKFTTGRLNLFLEKCVTRILTLVFWSNLVQKPAHVLVQNLLPKK